MRDSTEGKRSFDEARFISSADVSSLLSIESAVDALETGLRARTPSQIDGISRLVLQDPDRDETDEAELLLMPAFGTEGAGLKLVSIARGNEHRGLPLLQGLYVLLSKGGLTPELIIDGAALTTLRTAAVSALATRHLARPDSRRLVMFGAGKQAQAHVDAMRAVLPVEQVTIVGSSLASERAGRLVARLRAEGVNATCGSAAAVADADVICACTTSSAPVFDNKDVADGTHITAVGAYRLDMAEIPIATLRRGLLVVESIAATLAEAGDIVAAIRAGALPEKLFAYPIGDLLAGRITRSDARQVTIFKSVGLSVEDLIVARALSDALGAAIT